MSSLDVVKPNITLTFNRKGGGWIDTVDWNAGVPADFLETAKRIEERAAWAQAQGRRPLWERYSSLPGYNPLGDTRSSDQVRSGVTAGAFYTTLAFLRRPSAIVEFGTAFGVSGMYWLAGIETARVGQLYTYEPNDDWSTIAEQNLRAISDRFILTKGTFEEHAERTLSGTPVGIGFIDAIHTMEFVMSQYEILKRYLAPNAIVLFDDITFSDDMRACWQKVQGLPGVVSVAELGGRLGVVEFQ